MRHYLPQPRDLGLPAKFKSWRSGQVQAIMDIIDYSTQGRFLTQIQPTGSGKSLCYMTAALLKGGRALILTSLKGLQDQLMADFGDALGLAVVMGKSSYKCPKTGQSCEWAPCNYGTYCSKRRTPGCPYYAAVLAANKANIVVTNYSFWLCNKPDTLGEFSLLVCDEAHNAVSHLTDNLSVNITRASLASAGVDISWPGTADNLWVWASDCHRHIDHMIKNRLEQVKASLRSATPEIFKQLYKLGQLLKPLVTQDPDKWVVEYFTDHITYDPLWPPEFAEESLFRHIPTILLTSATMGRSTLSMLGIPIVGSLVKEYPSYFPVARRPIYYIPTVRVDHRISNLGYGLWCSRIDQIIGSRLDRKGIVHTISYDRCSRIMKVSEHKRYFHTHKSRDLLRSLRKFRDSGRPAVLCSPSVVTGWDFPYTQCEYQIVGKIPFPDARRKVDKARREKDSEYSCCIAMQNLVQICGRGMRYPDDQCENMIIDDHFSWFVRKYEKFAPKWWLDAVSTVRTIPEPPTRLPERRQGTDYAV